jgi:hypothetical protein
MVLYAATWKFRESMVATSYTYFSTLTPEDLEAEKGPEIKLLGRWHNASIFFKRVTRLTRRKILQRELTHCCIFLNLPAGNGDRNPRC